MTTWVFGYGSLVWRPAFAHAERVPARLDGWARRFWQGSTDHRGVPGAPGRVVTLIGAPRAHTTGIAYAVRDDVDAILAQLDHREKGGYDRVEAPLHLVDGRTVHGLAYIATPDNPNWLGPAPIAAIAATVRTSVGPSGPNLEYVTRLHEALAALDAVDDHLRELVEAL